MNGAFLHELTNHIPVIGVPLCALFLLIGIIRKNQELIRVSQAVLVGLALITIVVFRSGGPAAHIVRNFPEV